MTGQVKEDVITRFGELGVIVSLGEVIFEPTLLKREEFTSDSELWVFSAGGETETESLDAGSLGFTLCGVPVIYRLEAERSIQVFRKGCDPQLIDGNQLGRRWSQSLFRREKHIRKIIVNITEDLLR
jgi:hypothetical protein